MLRLARSTTCSFHPHILRVHDIGSSADHRLAAVLGPSTLSAQATGRATLPPRGAARSATLYEDTALRTQ